MKDTPKEENKTNFQPDWSNSNQADDDLFSNLVVSPTVTTASSSNQHPPSSSYRHLNEIEDLDISLPAKDEETVGDVPPSAFSFMNSCSGMD